MTAVARALPHAKLYGGDGLCLLSFTGARFHGIARSIARRFTCTSLPMPITAYPGGQAFLEAYHHSFGGRTPSAYAIYGYEAMKLGLDTIASLGDQGNNRQAVVKALFSTRDRHSVLGTYSFDRNGDTTLRSYGVWRPSGPRGRLRFVRNAFR
jgi:branched-chain amino acid transport system substrate-binding protein